MSLDEMPERPVRIAEVHEFDAAPERVWRAVTTPELRRRWLPDGDLASPDPISAIPGRLIGFRMREDVPPFLESTVTFRLEPNGTGGTRLHIVHDLNDARLASRTLRPANGNTAPLMRAA